MSRHICKYIIDLDVKTDPNCDKYFGNVSSLSQLRIVRNSYMSKENCFGLQISLIFLSEIVRI